MSSSSWVMRVFASPVLSAGSCTPFLPTAERMGDFSHTYLPSGALDVIYNPYTSTQFTDASGITHYTRTPYAGNVIQSGFDPVGQKLASLYPLPEPPGCGTESHQQLHRPLRRTTRLTTNSDWLRRLGAEPDSPYLCPYVGPGS